MGILEKVFYSAPGQAIATRAGLAEPPVLRRGLAWPQHQIILAAHGGARLAADTLGLLGLASGEAVLDDAGGDRAPGYGSKIGALVIDATGLRTIAELEWLRGIRRNAVHHQRSRCSGFAFAST